MSPTNDVYVRRRGDESNVEQRELSSELTAAVETWINDETPGSRPSKLSGFLSPSSTHSRSSSQGSSGEGIRRRLSARLSRSRSPSPRSSGRQSDLEIWTTQGWEWIKKSDAATSWMEDVVDKGKEYQGTPVLCIRLKDLITDEETRRDTEKSLAENKGYEATMQHLKLPGGVGLSAYSVLVFDPQDLNFQSRQRLRPGVEFDLNEAAWITVKQEAKLWQTIVSQGDLQRTLDHLGYGHGNFFEG